MLQCIVGMVEKTKRALAVLHQRSIQDREELALWVRRHSEGTEHDMKKRAGEMMAHTIRQTEDRVSEVKRRAGTSNSGIMITGRLGDCLFFSFSRLLFFSGDAFFFTFQFIIPYQQYVFKLTGV